MKRMHTLSKRLLLAETGSSLGYGVDEDTALIVNLDSGLARVAGRGGVTLIDSSFDPGPGALFADGFESGNVSAW